MSIKELDLINDQQAREQVIDRVEVLDKVGDLLLLPNTEYATIEQVAAYYGVTYQAIETIVNRHKDELKTDGYKTFRKREIIMMLDKQTNKSYSVVGKTILVLNDGQIVDVPNRGLRLFSKQSVTRIAFYLTESEVAQKVRTEILKIDPELYYNLSNAELLRLKKYEKDMGFFLKAVFGDDLVKTQVPCGDYLLDFVIDDTIHIEIDEYGHSGYDKIKEREREEYILNNTDYWTFRFNPQEDTKFQLLYDIFELYDHIGLPSAYESLGS